MAARADLGWGYVCADGTKRYSYIQPLYVKDQVFHSSQGILTCTLSCIGLFDLMDLDEANADYKQDSGSTYTIKDLIDGICAATLAPYTHCVAYTVAWDSDDAIFDTFKPADAFHIKFKESRLSALKRLLWFTKTVMRVESADSKIHFRLPTVSGSTYAYEYRLDVSGYHTFYAKTYRQSFLAPNYIEVESHPDDGDGFTGKAEDTTYSDLTPITPFTSGEIREHLRYRVASDAEAVSLAAAMLEKQQQDTEKGAGTVPVNCGQEIYDYVLFTDARQSGDTRAGNVGFINRRYEMGRTWAMDIGFGDILNQGMQWLLAPRGIK